MPKFNFGSLKEKPKVVSKPIIKPDLRPLEPIKIEGNVYQKIKDKFTNSSDFDRALVGAIDEFFPGLIERKALRYSKDKMIPNINRGIKKMREKLDIVEQLRNKYTPVYKEVMNELKQKLEEQKAKIES